MNQINHINNQYLRDRAVLHRHGREIARRIAAGEDRSSINIMHGIAAVVRRHRRTTTATTVAANRVGWLIADPTMAACRLAPIDHHSMGAIYRLRLGRHCVASYDTTRDYPRSCKYRAAHGLSECVIHSRVVRQMIAARCRTHRPAEIIGGIVTWCRSAPRSNPLAVRRAWWLETSGDGRRYNPTGTVRLVAGYIVGDYHTANRGEADRWVAARREEAERKAIAEAEWQTRHAADIEAARHFRGTFADSLASGNCRIGTAAFLHRLDYGQDETRRVSLRAIIRLADRRGVLNGAAEYLCRIARHFGAASIANVDDLREIAR